MALKIVVGKNKLETDELARATIADAFHRLSDGPLLFMGSGGSNLSLLDSVDVSNIDPSVTLTLGDDRFSQDPKINCYCQFMETQFYKTAMANGAKEFSMLAEVGESLEGFASRHENRLRNWFIEHPNGKALALFGMGADGHIAGIMPYPTESEEFNKLFVDTEKWVVGYDSSSKSPFPFRVTTTMKFWHEKVDETIIYAVGNEKRETIRRIMAESGELNITPARIINELLNARLYTDQIITA